MTSYDIAGCPASQELGEWPRSLSLLEKMFAAAVQGDVAMFNAVAQVCQKVLDAKKGWQEDLPTQTDTAKHWR